MAVPSVNVSAPTGPDDDAYWRRPADGPEATGSGLQRPPAGPAPAAPPSYPGPPRVNPPHPDWRPPTVAQPPPPRELPPQDPAAIDEAERSARTVTYGVGLIAAAVAMIALCLLCGRALF